MKKFYKITSWLFLIVMAASCNKKQGTAWDDRKSTSQIAHEGNALWGEDPLSGPSNEDFIPLQEEDLRAQLSDGAVPLSGDIPGEEGSQIPGADQFSAPTGTLASIFKTLHFNTDDHILRGHEQLGAVEAIAKYMKAHPKTFIFIEGHCDQRGPQAYNLALGSRRSNYVRTLLVERGVDPNQLHTISYGKERLLDERNISDAWGKNRRAQFKIYTKP